MTSTVESDPTAVRRYEPDSRRLYVSEVLPPRSRNFQLAHQIGLLALQPTFAEIAETSHLTTPSTSLAPRPSDWFRRSCRQD